MPNVCQAAPGVAHEKVLAYALPNPHECPTLGSMTTHTFGERGMSRAVPTAAAIRKAEADILAQRWRPTLSSTLESVTAQHNACARVAVTYILAGHDWGLDFALDAEAARLAGLDYWALNSDQLAINRLDGLRDR